MYNSISCNIYLKSLMHPPYSEDSVPTTNSSSCHVFMTESPAPGDEAAVMQTAKEFQFEPVRTEDGLGFKEFPADSDPIIEAVMNNYGKRSEDVEEGGASSPFPDVTFSSIESSPAKSSANR